MRFAGTALLGCAALLLSAALRAQTSPKSEAPLSHRALIDELVIANHILANEGVLDAYGHVSVRDSQNPEHFYLARHMAAGMVTAKDIIEYDLDSNPIVKSETAGYTERFIHSEIYRTRPDVVSVVHSHSPAVVPFSVVSGTKLRPICHMCGFLGAAAPVFEIRDVAGPGSDLLIRDARLGAALAQSLGQSAAILMRGHGSTVVGGTLRQAVFRAVYTEVCARLQSEAIRLGPVTYLTEEEGEATARTNDAQIDRTSLLWLKAVRSRSMA